MSFEASFNIQRVIAETQFGRAEDQTELSRTLSTRIADMIERVRTALEEIRTAQAQALAAHQAAQQAMLDAQAHAQASAALAEEAAASALDALNDALHGAEEARAVAEEAGRAVAALEDAEGNPALVAARIAAQDALDRALEAQREARELVESLGNFPVPIGIDAEMLARIRTLWSDIDITGLAQAQSNVAPSTSTGNTALVVLPTGDDTHVASSLNISADLGPRATDLMALLSGVDIPEALQQRAENLVNSMNTVDQLFESGMRTRAHALLAGLMPHVEELLDQLGIGGTGNTSATNTATSTGASPNGTTATSTAPTVAQTPAVALNGSYAVTGQEPIGGGFYGVGDHGRTGQDSLYEWLPRAVADQARASTHGYYLLASSQDVTTLQQHLRDSAVYEVTVAREYSDEGGSGVTHVPTYLSREAAIAALQEQGMTAAQISAHLEQHEMYLVRPAYSDGESGEISAYYCSRAEYLQTIGLPANAPMDLPIAFNNSGSGGGDAWLDRTHRTPNVAERGGLSVAYHAVVDDTLARDWVQIGDIGPLGDDIGKMLGQIYEQYGATTPEMQEIIRSVLFRYDERYGIIANREFIEAAVETNNNRRQGFFEGPVGRALLMVAVSFVPGLNAAGVAAMQAALSAAFTAYDGGSFGDMVRAALASYVGGQVGSFVGGAVNGALQGSVNAAIAAGISGAVSAASSSAVSQLIQTGRINRDSLIAAAISGGAGGMTTQLVSGTDWAQGLDRALGLNAGTIARFIGGQAGSLASGQGLSATSAISTLGAGLVTGSTERVDGSEVLEGISALLPRLSEADLTALEEANLGLGANTQILDRPPDGADFDIGSSSGSVLSDADISAAELERMGYTRNAQTGMETWRNPENGQIVYMRSADGATLAVADGRSVLRDPEGRVMSVEGGRFGEAFAQARASGAATFQWNGASYSTITREDVLRNSGGDVADYRAYVTRTGSHSLEGYMTDRADRAWAATPNPQDRQFWESRGFSPEQVATFYVTNGNDHRLAQLATQYEQTGSVPANSISSQGMATTIANNLGQLPEGAQTLYGIAVQGLSNFLDSRTTNGQAMSPWEAFGALCNAAVDRISGTAQNIRQNTSGPGEASVVVTGALLHAAWEGTGGALQRAYVTMTNPNATPEQVALATFEFMGAVASVAGAAVLMRGTTAGVTVSTSGLSQAGSAGALTIADAAGIILPNRPGGISHMDLAPTTVPNVPGGHLSPDLTSLHARIDNLDLTAYELRLIENYNRAVQTSNVIVLTPNTPNLPNGTHVPDGWAQSELGSVWLGIRQDYVNFTRFGSDPTGNTTVRELPDGRVIITNTFTNGVGVDPATPNPNTLPFDVTQLDIRTNAVVRHEYQHLLDFRHAAENPSSPYLLRIPWDGAPAGSSYSTFGYTELNGFRITAEEFSRAYIYAARTGDAAAAAEIVDNYRSILGTYDSLLNASSGMLGAALSPQSQALMRQSMAVSNTLPHNPGFVVVNFSIVGADGMPRTMQAQIPENTPPSAMVEAVNVQMRSGLGQIAAYRTIGESARRDFAAIEADFRQRFPGG